MRGMRVCVAALAATGWCAAAQAQSRYAEQPGSNYGGGLIEFLMTGDGAAPTGPRGAYPVRAAYAAPDVDRITLAANARATIALARQPAHRWYDVTVTTGDSTHRLAGHWETGAPGISEPALGGAA